MHLDYIGFGETRLFETLMQAYDRNVRPVTQATEAVNVSIYYDLHYINQYVSMIILYVLIIHLLW